MLFVEPLISSASLDKRLPGTVAEKVRDVMKVYTMLVCSSSYPLPSASIGKRLPATQVAEIVRVVIKVYMMLVCSSSNPLPASIGMRLAATQAEKIKGGCGLWS